MRSFPEYSMMVNSLNSIQKNEILCIDNMRKAFDDDGFPGYGKLQQPTTQETINKLTEAGIHYVDDSRKLCEQLADMPDYFDKLLMHYEEIMKWKVLLHNVETASQESTENAKRAKNAYDKARKSGNPNSVSKAEIALSSANRKAEDDKQSLAESKKRMSEVEEPYKAKFLEDFSSSLCSILDKRIEAVKQRKQVIKEFQDATATFVDYKDSKIDNYEATIQNYNDVLRNELNVE